MASPEITEDFIPRANHEDQVLKHQTEWDGCYFDGCDLVSGIHSIVDVNPQRLNFTFNMKIGARGRFFF